MKIALPITLALPVILVSSLVLAQSVFWWEAATPGGKPQVVSIVPLPVPVPAALLPRIPNTTVIANGRVSASLYDGKLVVKDLAMVKIDHVKGTVTGKVTDNLFFELPLPVKK